MKSSLLKKLTIGISCIPLIASVLFCFFVLFNNYEEFTTIILTKTGKLHRIDDFHTFVASGTYRWIRYASLLAVLASLLALVLIWKYATIIVEKANNFFKLVIAKIKNSFSSLSVFQIATISIVLIISTGFRLYYMFILPAEYDEIWTYVNFVKPGIMVTISYYITPNNHIFYSIIAWIFSHLPIEPILAMRIPNLIVSIMAAVVLFILVKDFLNTSSAIIAFTVFLFLSPVMYFSVMGRGYIFVGFFFLIGLYSVFRILNKSLYARTYWILFTVISILGAYTMPSYLYPFVSLFTLIIIYAFTKKDFSNIKPLVISSVVTGLVVYVLYLPVILINGLSAITNNRFVERKTFDEILINILPHFKSVSNWLVWLIYPVQNQGLYIMMTLLGILITFLIFSKHSQKWFLSFSFLGMLFILPFIFIFTHRVIPYNRTWFYLVVIIPIIAAMGAFLIEEFTLPLNRKLKLLISSLGLCSYIFVSAFFFYSSIQVVFYASYKGKEIYNQLDLQNGKRLYVNQEIYDTVLLYSFLINNDNIVVDRYKNFNPNVDYDYMILNKKESLVMPKDSLEQKYIVGLENDWMCFYKKK